LTAAAGPFEDLVGGFGPDEPARVAVVVVQELEDRRNQFISAAEDRTAQPANELGSRVGNLRAKSGWKPTQIDGRQFSA
jgi:hypothetical protein